MVFPVSGKNLPPVIAVTTDTKETFVRATPSGGLRYMLARKHVGGVGSKEQRMYEHIREQSQKSGRYGKRAKEVAARTVLKHHKQSGHAKGR